MKPVIQALFAAVAAAIQQLDTLPADSKLDGTTIVQYTMDTSHCEMFEPIMNEAVANSGKLGLKFAQIDCGAHPALCKHAPQDLPVLEVWRNGLERTIRPSTHSVGVLEDFFAAIAEGPLSEPYTEHDTDGNPTEKRLTRLYEPFIQREGTPIPVYPKRFEPVYAKGEVVLLSPENFEDTIVNSGEPWMVKFYSPRCPYSRAMAAEWQRYTDTGLFNIAEFDCLQDVNFCIANGIEFWPTILYIDGEYRREFVSTLEIPQYEAFHQMQSGAQIVPTRDFNELITLIDGAASRGVASFVYVHDESTVFEDWDALVNQTDIFSQAQSTVIRSDNSEVRDGMGLTYSGSNLVFAGKTVKNNGDEGHYFYTFADGHDPSTIRDYQQVKRWVNEVRFSQPILLNTSQLHDMNEFSDVHAILIAHNTRHEKFKDLRKASRESFEDALATQKDEHARLRDIRHSMHTALKEAGKKNQYRKVYQTPIVVPLQSSISYSYIPKGEWDEQFGQILDTSAHEEGDIIIVDFAKGIYADNVAGAKLSSFDPSALESYAKPFLKSVGLKPKDRSPIEFKPNFNFGDRLALMGKTNWLILSGLAVAGAVGLAKLARRCKSHRVPLQLPRYSKLD